MNIKYTFDEEDIKVGKIFIEYEQNEALIVFYLQLNFTAEE